MMKYLLIVLLLLPAVLKAQTKTDGTINLIITVLAQENDQPLKNAFVLIKTKQPIIRNGISTNMLFDIELEKDVTNAEGKVEYLTEKGRGIPRDLAEKNEIVVSVEHTDCRAKWVELGSDILISTASPVEYTIWLEKSYGTDILLQNIITDPGKLMQNNKNVNRILRINETEYLSHFPSGDKKTEIKIITPPPKGLKFYSNFTVVLEAKAKNINWGTRIFMYWGSTNIVEKQKIYFNPEEVYIGIDPLSGTIITSRTISFDVTVPSDLYGQEATLWIYLQEGSASSIAWVGYNYK